MTGYSTAETVGWALVVLIAGSLLVLATWGRPIKGGKGGKR